MSVSSASELFSASGSRKLLTDYWRLNAEKNKLSKTKRSPHIITASESFLTKYFDNEMLIASDESYTTNDNERDRVPPRDVYLESLNEAETSVLMIMRDLFSYDTDIDIPKFEKNNDIVMRRCLAKLDISLKSPVAGSIKQSVERNFKSIDEMLRRASPESAVLKS